MNILIKMLHRRIRHIQNKRGSADSEGQTDGNISERAVPVTKTL